MLKKNITVWHEMMGFISSSAACCCIKAEIGFDILKYCSKGCFRKINFCLPQGNVNCAAVIGWLSWKHSQIKCILGYWINAFLCFQTHKKTKQHYIKPLMNVFLDFVFTDYFPTQPHQVPLGHLLKWLNPADSNLINILVFVTFQKHSYNSLDSWMKKATEPPR